MRKLILIPLLLVPLLFACSAEEPETSDGDPPLLRAAEMGDLAELDRLLASQPLVDSRDQCQWTPLMKAALNGHADAVTRLLEHGADPQAADKGGYTALLLAASNNHAGIVEQLLAVGAQIDVQEVTQGWSALIWAAKRGHLASVKVLLEAVSSLVLMAWLPATGESLTPFTVMFTVATLESASPSLALKVKLSEPL